MPIFSKILEQGRTSKTETGFIEPGTAEASRWYRERAMQVRSVKLDTVIRRNTEYNRSVIKPGFMYLFNYDPKLKEELPYYDRYPLIFPFEKTEDGFLGMNLHYIPPIFRAKLMDNLYPLVSNDKFDETTKLKMSYNMLKSASRYKYFKPCIKRYLNSHVQSKFLLIPANEWDIALFLPLDRFTKKSRNTVYADSRRIINNS